MLYQIITVIKETTEIRRISQGVATVIVYIVVLLMLKYIQFSLHTASRLIGNIKYVVF